MNIPEKVRIGSCDYSVNIIDEKLILNARECKGIIDYEFHNIKINNEVQDMQGKEQTFLHELLHGIVKERNLDLSNSDEETIVDEIAMGLHQVIRDNPYIFKAAENKNLYINTTPGISNNIRSIQDVKCIIDQNIRNLKPITYSLSKDEIRAYIETKKE